MDGDAVGHGKDTGASKIGKARNESGLHTGAGRVNRTYNTVSDVNPVETQTLRRKE